MATPVASSPAPLPVAAPVASEPLKPGAQTSEGWLTALTIAIGSLPAILKALGVKYDISPIVQAVGLIIGGLSGMHYTAQRSSLKRAYVTGAQTVASKVAAPAFAASATIVALIALLACGAGKTGTQVLDGAGSAASAGLHCEAVNLEQDVSLNGQSVTLLSAVGSALLAGDYIGALDILISKLGTQAVGCTELAIEDFEQSLESVGSAVAATGALAPSVLLQHARAAHAHYGWSRALKAAFRTHASMGAVNTADIGTGDMSSARKRGPVTVGVGSN